jgi:hypothetical protein
MFPRHGLFNFSPKIEILLNALALFTPDFIPSEDEKVISNVNSSKSDLKFLHKSNP